MRRARDADEASPIRPDWPVDHHPSLGRRVALTTSLDGLARQPSSTPQDLPSKSLLSAHNGRDTVPTGCPLSRSEGRGLNGRDGRRADLYRPVGVLPVKTANCAAKARL